MRWRDTFKCHWRRQHNCLEAVDETGKGILNFEALKKTKFALPNVEVRGRSEVGHSRSSIRGSFNYCCEGCPANWEMQGKASIRENVGHRIWLRRFLMNNNKTVYDQTEHCGTLFLATRPKRRTMTVHHSGNRPARKKSKKLNYRVRDWSRERLIVRAYEKLYFFLLRLFLLPTYEKSFFMLATKRNSGGLLFSLCFFFVICAKDDKCGKKRLNVILIKKTGEIYFFLHAWETGQRLQKINNYKSSLFCD